MRIKSRGRCYLFSFLTKQKIPTRKSRDFLFYASCGSLDSFPSQVSAKIIPSLIVRPKSVRGLPTKSCFHKSIETSFIGVASLFVGGVPTFITSVIIWFESTGKNIDGFVKPFVDSKLTFTKQ